MTTRFKFFATSIFLSAVLGFSGLPEQSARAFIRVSVLDDVEEVTVYIRGNYQIKDLNSGRTIDEGRRLRWTKVHSRDGQLHLGSHNLQAQSVQMTSNKDITLKSHRKKKTYRGAINIHAQEDGTLMAVNHLDVESYVRGVLYNEVTDRWPMEAMMAQAVAARTYAFYQIRERKEYPYDVTGDIYSQVYGGRSSERYRTNIAAEKTKGKILMYGGEVLPAYFHANSGGHTENARHLWKIELDPLAGRPDPFAVDKPGYSWKRNFRSSQVQEELNKNGRSIGPIKTIRVKDRTGSGRAKTLEIIDRKGNRIDVPGKRFRGILGPNTVRSTLFDVQMKGYYFDLVGKGWGHGVGMCQWGAHEMAQRRYEYDDILGYYYPGATIKDINGR